MVEKRINTWEKWLGEKFIKLVVSEIKIPINEL